MLLWYLLGEAAVKTMLCCCAIFRAGIYNNTKTMLTTGWVPAYCESKAQMCGKDTDATVILSKQGFIA